MNIRYDLVDITRQTLQLLFDKIYKRMVYEFKASNKPDFNLNSKVIPEILEDLNAILSTNRHFLLGNWIESAKSLANSDQVFVNFY